MHKNSGGFFSKHAKSSALLVSVIVHAFIILVAISFVAVSVVTKKETNFEAKQIKKPKMKLRKLKVPVKDKKNKTPKPKLRHRLVIENKQRNIPEFKMPEIAGIKGGVGSVSGDAAGGVGDIGFQIPQFKIFGIKNAGEKIFIMLDSSNSIMKDEIGGMLSYKIIKEELMGILKSLNGGVVFNLGVYDTSRSVMLFDNMRPGTPANIKAAVAFLEPLNKVSANMGDNDFGIKTLRGGTFIRRNDIPLVEPVRECRNFTPLLVKAAQQQADTIFLLASSWGSQHHVESDDATWNDELDRKYKEAVAECKKKLSEENKQRKSKGLPPRVFSFNTSMVRYYMPNVKIHHPKFFMYNSKHIMKVVAKAYKDNEPKADLSLKLPHKKKGFKINVVHFVPKDGDKTTAGGEKLEQLTKRTKGKHRVLKGLDAIRASSNAYGE